MAQYTKRGHKWQARIFWHDSQGKRRTKSKSGFRTKALAKKWGSINESQLRKGVAIDKDIPFAEYFEQWVKTYKKTVVSDKSMVTYRTTIKQLREYFGNQSIKTVDRLQYQQYINQFGAHHAPSTVQKINGFIRAAVQSAILDDYITKDFTQGVALTSNKNLTIKVQYLSIHEIKALLKYCEQHALPGFTGRYMIITAIYTGMRLSEIQALMWNDISWREQTITINKSWDAVKHQFKPTKNVSSNRTIKVNSALLKWLKQLQKRAKSTMVFTNQYGTIPTSGAVNRTLRQSLKALHIHKRNFHFHSLRHSHVALLLAKGIDIYAISKRLGHINIKTTANVYAYLIDEYKNKTDQQIITALSSL